MDTQLAFTLSSRQLVTNSLDPKNVNLVHITSEAHPLCQPKVPDVTNEILPTTTTEVALSETTSAPSGTEVMSTTVGTTTAEERSDNAPSSWESFVLNRIRKPYSFSQALTLVLLQF